MVPVGDYAIAEEFKIKIDEKIAETEITHEVNNMETEVLVKEYANL